MSITWILLRTFGLAAASAPSSGPATDSIRAQGQERVATVLGQPVLRWEVDIPEDERRANQERRSAEEHEQWLRSQRGRRLLGKVAGPLRDKFVKAHALQANPGEVREFHEGMDRLRRLGQQQAQKRLQRIQQELVQAGLTPEEKSDLEKAAESTRRRLETGLQIATRPMEKGAEDRVANFFVESWKFNKALYDTYGGRVIWQQAGIEPLEAMERWLQAAERAGDFEVPDASLRDDLYHYFRQRHISVSEADPFDQPWWLQDPPRPQPIRAGRRRIPPEPLLPSGELDAR